MQFSINFCKYNPGNCSTVIHTRCATF